MMKQETEKTTRRSVCRNVTVVSSTGFAIEERELVEEIVYQIIVNGEQVSTVTCSPWDIREAALGCLYMNGVIRSAEEVSGMEIRPERGEISVCAEKKSPLQKAEERSETLTLTAAEVLSLSHQLEENSRLFRRTGGVHCAALARGGELLAYKEDVSRHAAVDKLVGECLDRNVPMQGGVLVFSGRVAAEILHKVERMGCAAIIARSAPTDYACALAEKADITLIGFAREESFNIYTCPNRVIV